MPKRSFSSATGSPAFNPMRTLSGVSPCPAMARWTATAHSIAREAEGKEAMMPSPVCLVSLPPWALRASRTMLSWVRRSSWALASPRRSVSVVEPSMSVKKMVWTSSLASDMGTAAASSPSDRNSSMACAAASRSPR